MKFVFDCTEFTKMYWYIFLEIFHVFILRDNVFMPSLVGSVCTDLVDIQQNGDDELGRSRFGIVPALNFTCSGRISRIIARVRRDNNMDRNDYPYFQVWRPSPTNSQWFTTILVKFSYKIVKYLSVTVMITVMLTLF